MTQCASAQFSAHLSQSTVYEGQTWSGTLSISYDPALNGGIGYGSAGSYGIQDFNGGTFSFSGSTSASGTLNAFDPKPDAYFPAPYNVNDLVPSLGVSFSGGTVFTQDTNGALAYGVNVSAGGSVSVYRQTSTNPLNTWAYVGNQSYGVSSQTFQFAVVNVAPTVTGMQFGTSPGSLSSAVQHVDEGQTIFTRMYASDPGADTLQFRVDTDHSSQTLGYGNTNTPGAVRYSEVQNVQVFDGFTGAVRDDEEWSYLQPTNLVIHNLDPIFDGWSLPTDALAGDLFSFNATAHDPGLDSLVFDWDFDGDGLYDDFTGSSGQYSYSSNGTYTVGLRISDGDGGFAYQSQQVTVTPEPQSIALFGCGMLALFGWRKRRHGLAAQATC